MSLSAQDIAFFDVFGYLILPQLFNQEEVSELSNDFEKIALADRDGKDFEGEKRQDIALIDTPSWKRLMESDRIYRPLRELLGARYTSTQMPSGGLYVGDTQWHPDVAKVDSQRRIKGAVYLDPVRRDSGCLRVVPGSHKHPLHNEMQPLRMGRIKESLDNGTLMSNVGAAGDNERAEIDEWAKESGINMDKDNTIFGWDPTEIPSTALESNPGDVVLFNQCIFHAAFGGKTGRRMVAMTWAADPTEPGHVKGELVRER